MKRIQYLIKLLSISRIKILRLMKAVLFYLPIFLIVHAKYVSRFGHYTIDFSRFQDFALNNGDRWLYCVLWFMGIFIISFLSEAFFLPMFAPFLGTQKVDKLHMQWLLKKSIGYDFFENVTLKQVSKLEFYWPITGLFIIIMLWACYFGGLLMWLIIIVDSALLVIFLRALNTLYNSFSR